MQNIQGINMQTINIEALSTKQKFIALEEIWDSLKKDNAKELVPDWHLEVLEQREKKHDFIDLEESKKALQDMLKQ